MSSILNFSVAKLSRLMREKELSSYDITIEYLKKITEEQKENNAYITVLHDEAKKSAEKNDNARIKGEITSDIAGIPFAVKDNICTKGIKTTCGSKMLENYVPVYNAKVMELLSECVVLGKTNMDEFAMGVSSESSYFGPVKNPFCSGRIPGGSSSGSAVSVASNEAAFALGSDTGGSVRQPSSFCDVVGYKPSYGLVSRYGLIAFAPSFDQIGIISKNVPDCALVAQNICRYDRNDSTSENIDIPFADALSFSVKGKKVAVPYELITGYSKEKILLAASLFASEGAEVECIDLPYADCFLEAYYILSSAEASSNLGRFDGVRYGYVAEGCGSADEVIRNSRTEGFGSEVKRRIILGTFSLSAGYIDDYYNKALNLRNSLISEYNKIFSMYDFILSPVSKSEPWAFGTKQDVDMYVSDMCTVAANLIGAPAISVPAGYTKSGFPAGVQLMAGKFCDAKLLGAAALLEQGIGGGTHV